MEWQREMTDPNEFMSTLHIDLYPEEVYTFTPKGKVIVLPKDASPIDFAYAIHTDVGHATIGAKVNGRIVPLRTRLRNGDIVEVTTQAGHAPSRDWLSFTKSSRARNKIKHWLNENQRARAIEIGNKLLQREARKYKLSLDKFKNADYERVAAEYGLGTVEDLLAGIGFGKYSARQVLNKLEPGSTLPAEAATSEPGTPGNTLSHMSEAVKRVFFGKGSDSLQVEGQDDLLVYRARCCNPIRGEEIIGYVTRGKGVAVHARSCPNVQNLLYEADRRIDVAWAESCQHLTQLSQADHLPRQAGHPRRRPLRPAQGVRRHHLRGRHQHQVRRDPPRRRRGRLRRLRHRDPRPPPPHAPHPEPAQGPGRPRRPPRAEGLGRSLAQQLHPLRRPRQNLQRLIDLRPRVLAGHDAPHPRLALGHRRERNPRRHHALLKHRAAELHRLSPIANDDRRNRRLALRRRSCRRYRTPRCVSCS